MRSLPAAAAAAGRSVYFLGGDPGAGEAAAAALRAASPALRIAGVECPPFGFEKDAAYTTALRARLQAAAPDVVFVALGSPKQEFVIRDLRMALPAAWWLGVGISFSFVAGDEMKLLKDIEKTTRQKIPATDRRNDKSLGLLDQSIMAAGVGTKATMPDREDTRGRNGPRNPRRDGGAAFGRRRRRQIKRIDCRHVHMQIDPVEHGT
jgi:hypothetical protein